jgi:hypothetical protein
MRHTLNAIDPLPAFPSDSLSFELQDSEPAYQPSERHKRLPSYREVLEAEVARKNSALDIAMARAWRTISDDTKCSLWEIARFNGKCDPHITEADCRKRKSAPAEQPKQSTDAPQFKVGDKVLIRTIASWACGMWGVITDETVSRGERVLIVTVAGGIGAYRERDLELLPTEPAPQEPQADAEGWIPWAGGQPAPADLVGRQLEVRFSSGNTYAMRGNGLVRPDASGWTASAAATIDRIVAYRIVA